MQTFNGEKVFITGHTGFKGTWLTRLLHTHGAEVTGYSLPTNHLNAHFNSLGLKNQINHITGDVNSFEDLRNALLEAKPKFIFHLAAQALVRDSYSNPVETFQTNVMGGVNLLQAVRATNSVRSIVFVTSDKCYQNQEWVWGYRETDLLGGKDPYSASKAAAEIVFHSFYESFFKGSHRIGTGTARAGNVIGGGDWSADRIIPDCIRNLEAGKPIELRNPSATRPWQHVLEPLSGYLTLAKKLHDSPATWNGSWNFGPKSSEVRNVKQIAQMIIKYFGKGDIKILENLDSSTPEAHLLQLNCEKANSELNWHPRWDVDKALEMTANWYKKVGSGEPVDKVTDDQIKEYVGS